MTKHHNHHQHHLHQPKPRPAVQPDSPNAFEVPELPPARPLSRIQQYDAHVVPNLSIFNYNVTNVPVEQSQETKTDGCLACFKSLVNCLKR